MQRANRGGADAKELDVILLAELRFARLDFEASKKGRRSLTSEELAGLTGATATVIRTRLRALGATGEVFEHRIRDRWTARSTEEPAEDFD